MSEEDNQRVKTSSANGLSKNGSGAARTEKGKAVQAFISPKSPLSSSRLPSPEDPSLKLPQRLRGMLPRKVYSSPRTDCMSAKNVAKYPEPIPAPLFDDEEETPCAYCEQVLCVCS